VRIGNISGARLGIQGSGTTSATIALLVQNSAGTQALKIADDGRADFSGPVILAGNITIGNNVICLNGFFGNNLQIDSNGSTTIGAQASAAASSILDIRSTTKGFLPPRMTTTQINAIASPAEGLVAYNTTINHLCAYQGGAWVKFNHSPM
jgi:hypothetical protein